MLQLLETYVTGPVSQISMQLSQGEGAIAAAISLFIFGSMSLIARKAYLALKHWFMKKFIVSLVVSEEDAGLSQLRIQLSDFIMKHSNRHLYAILMNQDRGRDGARYFLTPENGKGFFFKGFRPYFFERTEKKLSLTEGTDTPPKLIIKTFGLGKQTVLDILGKQISLLEPDSSRYYYTAQSFRGDVCLVSSEPMEKAPKIFLNKEVLDEVSKAVEFYRDNREWYIERGLSHKLNIVLYGPPGTGKTSVSRLIADMLDMNLASVNAVSIPGGQLRQLLSSCRGANAVCSIQDFDNCKGFHSREVAKEIAKEIEDKKETTKTKEDPKQPGGVFDRGLDISEVLNTFQGDIPLNDVVTVFSTNHIEKIDSAFLRLPRTDVKIFIPPIEFEQVQQFYNYYYETHENLPVELNDIYIPAGEVMGFFQQNAFDKKKFVEALCEQNCKRKGIPYEQPQIHLPV